MEQPRGAAGPVVRTGQGRVEGRWSGDIAAFLAMPYAAPPVGELRFAPPQRPAPWEGTRPADRPGIAAVQAPFPPETAIGRIFPQPLPGQGEDCLTVNVWTPAKDPGDRLPVMVWLHGGGFLIGAGSAPHYAGTELARRGDVVVVSLNYRLGALGYLHVPEHTTEANFGLQDQIAALEWVQENIRAFGGDPDSVTLFGQSAGAYSILALGTVPHARRLFTRAIVQSAPIDEDHHGPDRAAEVTALFLDAAGIPGGDLHDLRALSVDRLLHAQNETVRRWHQPDFGASPFAPVADGGLLTTPPGRAALAGSLDHIELMIGCTTEEALFFPEVTALWDTDEAPRLPKDAAAYLRHAAQHPGEPPARLLSRVITDTFAAHHFDIAEHRATTARPAYVYQWRHPCTGWYGRLGACHCAELPFLFGNVADWRTSALLEGTDPWDIRYLTEHTQNAWTAFARSGDPDPAGTLGWTPYTSDTRTVLALDTPVKLLTTRTAVTSSHRDAPVPVT
ncbi:carboxylesterase/lipase family protein [Streptomyces sp. NPDC021093]|uniref:carboxylesterase/lipase family protein n=1 Tax=Streptomyces sp. NPDC021093 TaxID=3365112 RepID=UPI0037959617